MTALELLFRAVADASWRASLLVLAVLLLRPLLRGRLPARVLFWAWLALAVRLLLPVTLPVAWSPFAASPLPSPPAFLVGILELDTENPLPAAAPPPPAAAGSPPETRGFRPSALQWAALVWVAGVAALVLARVAGGRRFARRLRRASHAPAPDVDALLAKAAAQSGVRPPPLLVTPLVRAPALQGLFRPRLLLPPGLTEQLTPAELQAVFAHELAHAQRRDLPAHALLHAAAIVHWFNPLAWLAARAARHDCELACDAHVVRSLPDAARALYGATLLKIIQLTPRLTPPPLALGVVETKHQLHRRLLMIVTRPSSRPVVTALSCALFLAAAALSLTRTLQAQSVSAAPAATPPVRQIAGSEPSPGLPADNLDTLFPGGTVATIGDRTITVTDVRREMAPLLVTLQRDTRDPAVYQEKLRLLQNSVITTLLRRLLLIREFPHGPDGPRTVSAEQVDQLIADATQSQFNNDRAQLLAYLRARGQTMHDYRKSVEEDIMFRYMMGQEKSARRPEPATTQEGKTHLRLIQLTRTEGESDAALLARAHAVLARFRAGEKFADLARELSGDKRAAKGGDWGWLAITDLKGTYRDAFSALNKGDVSAPLLAPEGAFLLYAEDRK